MTTPQLDALIKVHNQIRIAEKYQAEEPGMVTPKEILKILRKREHDLNNELQVQIFKCAIAKGNS